MKIKFTEADHDGLRKFLVEEKNFNSERVESYIERYNSNSFFFYNCRLQKAKEKCKQKRMDSFFSVKKSTSSVKRPATATAKDSKKSKK